jgi:UDP-N-acetylglucosamine 4-epimerase
MQLMRHESPVINGNGDYSRDFTYIDNIIQMNELAILANKDLAVNTVYNAAFGERTSLNELVEYLKEYLSEYDFEISKIQTIHGSVRIGDIPHSIANIDKAKDLLGYSPQFSVKEGLKAAAAWYFENLPKLLV